MYVLTSGVNETRGHQIWNDKPLEGLDMSGDTLGKVFRYLQREYGRCTSKMYVDTKDGQPQQVGWVFQKVCRYSDSKDTYEQTVWCEVLKQKPTVTIIKVSAFSTGGSQ